MHKQLVASVIVIAAACGGKAVIDGHNSGGAGGMNTTTPTGTTTTTSSTTTSTTSSGGNFTSCDGPGQCMLAWPGCCDGCQLPQLDDLVPINGSQLDAFRADQCPNPEGCPDCIGCVNGNLFAFCDNGTCRGADLRVHELSECSAGSDCKLRAGSGCCENCSVIDVDCGGLTAIHNANEGGLSMLVCEIPVASCPPCAPTYPPEAFADCVGGHCAVIISNQ